MLDVLMNGLPADVDSMLVRVGDIVFAIATMWWALGEFRKGNDFVAALWFVSSLVFVQAR